MKTKKEVLDVLRKALRALEKEKVDLNKQDLDDIVRKYRSTIHEIEIDALNYNEIHNSVKAYLEIYNDYDNILLYQMSDAEEAVESYLSSLRV
ncbi:hypothetical protein [Erwinia oleae]|uniref:hypothetical protein n=1 Tax=Erwinia oleae TaxID=796334 RepID=UPI0005514F41|nr:hypothetical protein [Erwinia oleae]